MELKNIGQTTVEYVLLLAVIGLLAFAVINNDRFQNFIGPNGQLFTVYGDYIGFTYRHGTFGTYQEIGLQEDYVSEHDTYIRPPGGAFRIPLENYPE